MKAYTVNGKEKTIPTDCPTCKGGEVWLTETFEVEFGGPKTVSRICGRCNTKYIFATETKPIEQLDMENATVVAKYLEEERTKFEERSLMRSDELYARKKLFLETGVCKHPDWVTSHPIRTSEGQFIFKSCPVCHHAQVNYMGKTYGGNIMQLVKFIATKGINAEKEKAKKQSLFLDLGLDKVPLSATADDSKPTVTFDDIVPTETKSFKKEISF